MATKKLTDSELLIKYSKYDDYMKAVAARNEALRAAGSPWVDAPLKTETGAYNIPTLDESLYWEYVAGLITLHGAAREFCRANWDAVVDKKSAIRRFREIDKKYHKLGCETGFTTICKSKNK